MISNFRLSSFFHIKFSFSSVSLSRVSHFVPLIFACIALRFLFFSSLSFGPHSSQKMKLFQLRLFCLCRFVCVCWVISFHKHTWFLFVYFNVRFNYLSRLLCILFLRFTRFPLLLIVSIVRTKEARVFSVFLLPFLPVIIMHLTN